MYDFEYDLSHGEGPDSNNSSDPDYDPYYVVGVGGPNWDPQTLFFESLATPARGWATYAKMFQMLDADGIDLGVVSGGEISQLRSEYTLAYLSLGHGENLTSSAIDYHVGERPYFYENGTKVDCWRENPGCHQQDGGDSQDWSLVAYTPDEDVVTSIVDAHCRVAAAENANNSEALIARWLLNAGSYVGAIGQLNSPNEATCGANCPSECGCYASHCAAPWHD